MHLTINSLDVIAGMPTLVKLNVNFVKHAFLMADTIVVQIFETRKLRKLHPTQALLFDDALANSVHEMDGLTLFIKHYNCPFMFKSKVAI